MLTITLGDLRYRARRFGVAVVGAAVVFALAVLMSGLAVTFDREIETTVVDAGADAWVVAATSTGPFTGFDALPAERFLEVLAAGATAADPIVFFQATAVGVGAEPVTTNVIGHRPGGLGAPTLLDGSAVAAAGEAVVDVELGAALGDTVTLGGRPYTVVGRTEGHRLYGGLPNAYLSLSDVQAGLFGGLELVLAWATAGVPTGLPADLRVLTNEEVVADTSRIMANAGDSVKLTRSLMWAVAVLIVAALVYVTAIERTRDFAVLKAMGAGNGLPAGSLVLQAVLVTLVAVALATVLAQFLQPVFALPVEVPLSAYRDLVVVAIVVGVVSSLAGARRAMTVDPALAFGGA